MKSLRVALALLIGVSAMAQVPLSAVQPDSHGQLRQVLENFGQSALTLEENRGQAPQGVDFVALGFGHKFLLSSTGATVELFDPATKSSHSVHLQLAGASPSSRGAGLDRVAFTSAYFTASDTEGRLRSLPNFTKVRYREVWRGIDVVYYGNRDKLEYDMVVAPHADPRSIRIKLTGESRFALNSAGDLELRTPYGTVIHHRPLAFQVIDHQRQEVRAGYALVAGNEVRIQLGSYDRSHELVIDPTLAISSPTITSPATAVLAGVDGSGNIYTAVAGGQGSIFIVVFGSNGVAINQGTISGADTTAGMVVTSAGKVYLTGAASGNSFPANGYQTKLADSDGLATDAYLLEYVGLPNQNVLYGTFFGGIGNDSGNAIAVDGAGNAYITGQTVGGAGFVHTTGAAFGGGGTDAFVAKFNPLVGGPASLIFSTFIGGSGADSGNGIGVDSNGNAVYVGGATTSTSASFQPSSATGFNPSKTTATNDGFLVKLNSTGASATYLTFIPSAPVNALAVDSSFSAYVTGAVDGTTNVLATTVGGFQLTNGGNGCASIAPGSACTDAFLSKYNTTLGGGSLLYSTYIGGTLSDAGFGVAVDNSGNAYVVGRTNSGNFPTARPMAGLATYQGGAIVNGNTLNTQFDVFVSKINTNDSGLPSLVYSTYLGGTDTDQANNVAIDGSGNAFIGGISSSTDFPNTTGVASATGAHGFFAKITDSSAGTTLSITKTHTGSFSQGQANATYTVTVSNVGSAATSGTVTVTETVPAGLVLVSMSGTGWTCTTLPTCTRSDVLNPNSPYAPIIVTVNVNGNATSPQVNQVSVSGGGSPAANASDSTTILTAASLSITKTHSGNFTQGQQGAIYTVTVSNAAGAATTSGLVTVTETVPGGLVLVSMAGTGWTCTVSPTCTRNDALIGGAGYPPITVTVNVAGGAASPQNNQVSVSGGGSAVANGNDSTTVLASSQPSLSITKTHSGNFAQGQQNATYTVTVSNNNGAATTSGAVTVTDTLPAGLALVSMAGTGWNCSSNTCTRSDALAGGASYAAITVTVNVLGNATSPQVNQVNVSGGGSSPAGANDSTVISIGTPAMTVNRTRLNFGYSGNSLITSPQTVTVSISGGVSVGWTVSSSRGNVTVSPASGTGSGTFQVTATPPAGGGSSGAVLTVSASGATGSPQQVQVNVTSVTPTMPFGSFDTPINNTSGIAGAVGVTGWALDSIEVTNVGIWREPVPGEATAPNGLVFIGNANFVADARPDVAGTYPNLPYQYRGGWGYLMLTNFLRNSTGAGPLGNGTYNLHVLVTNKSGTIVDLGTRTITVDNAHASKPFGTIDTPDQGGSATGNAFVNFGWALTQNPFFIPMDGSTITVILDGVAVGHPTYNQFRSDIAGLFPGLANSNGAVGFFFIDTTKLQNKVHTISWNAFDNGGRGDGLGSRYFTVFNVGGGVAAPEEPPTPESLAGPVQLRSGYDFSAPAAALAPDAAGAYSIEMEQLGRIELSLGASKGYLAVGDEAGELPLGSTLKAGVFYWQAPLGFLGKYELLFERPDGSQTRIRVNIAPKQYSLQ